MTLSARWVATIAGLIGFVLSIATPLLPVVQTTAMLTWPQNGQLNSVTSPLISLTPVDFTASVPCSIERDLPPSGGVIVGTAPKQGKDANLNALFVVVSAQRVDVTDRNVVILSVPRELMRSPNCVRIDVTSTHAGTFAEFIGLKDPRGAPLRSGFPDPNLRPQIVGVFTDLTGKAPPALSLSATIDTRFSTAPTTLNANFLNAKLYDNTAKNNVTGNNSIMGNAFAGASGIPIVIQNSGNNVIIQNGMVLNLTMQ